MLDGKNILVLGARAGGYGESIALEAVRAGARVFGTTLTPEDPREMAFFEKIGVELIDIPLKFDFDHRERVFEDLKSIGVWLKQRGAARLDAVIHAVAGGFPRQPSAMKAVGEILKGNQTFGDLATLVKRNVYYVNAGSFEDTVLGLESVTDDGTVFMALTYRGELPYFIAPTKSYLERIALRLAKRGKRTLIAALPESWTQSSQFFTGIEVAIVQNYLTSLTGATRVPDHLAEAFSRMSAGLEQLEGFQGLLADWPDRVGRQWDAIDPANPRDLYSFVQELFTRMRAEGSFSTLRRAVEIMSEFVREASGAIVAREFLQEGRFEPGDVRQVFYSDLVQQGPIGTAAAREKRTVEDARRRDWKVFDKDDIRETLNMYGPNFLFLDRVIMDLGDIRVGFVGFASFTVPDPEKNPILKEHFVGMPLFGGHLQMEAAAQLGSFLMLRLSKDKRSVPILTGSEFPDLNTMAPPGEKLTIMGVIQVKEKRNLTMEVTIENRFARSKGVVRGMMVNERLVRKMVTAFNNPDAEE